MLCNDKLIKFVLEIFLHDVYILEYARKIVCYSIYKTNLVIKKQNTNKNTTKRY